MRMKPKIQNFFVAASLFVGALGLGGTAQAIQFTGNASTSTTLPILSLSYTGASFDLDVPVLPLGPTDLNLGTFTLNGCVNTGGGCEDDFGLPSVGFTDFILKITFTFPTVTGSPTSFGADISGKFGREGDSDEIAIHSSLTINFDNSVHTLSYTGGPGGSFGQFDVWVDDPTAFGPYTNSGSKFSKENLTRQVTGHIGNLTQEFPGSGPGPDPSPVPEPSTFLMMFLGLLMLGRSVSKKWFSN